MKQPHKRPQKSQPTATITPRDLARECGWGITNTYKMLADGTIPSIRVGNRFFIPRVALENWLATCGKPTQHGS